MRYWILTLLLLSLLPAARATTLPEFNAVYHVYALGMQLGESHQQLRCQSDGNCTLHARTFPTGLARMFTNETLEETSHLHPTGDALQWQRYVKKTFEDGRLKKTVTLIRESDRIRYAEKQRDFPARPHLFDLLSLPLAIGFYLKHKTLPEALYAQDNNWQDPLKLIETGQRETFTFGTPPGAADEEEDSLTGGTTAAHKKPWMALRYTLDMPHARVRIWMLPGKIFFPAQVEIYRKDDDRTLILKLARPVTFS